MNEFEQKLTKISNKIIIIIIFLSLSLLIYLLFKSFNYSQNLNIDNNYYLLNEYYKPYIIFAIILIIFWILIFFALDKSKPIILVSFISIIFSLYLVEVLFFSNIWLNFKKTYEITGFDKRSKFEVIQEFNDDKVVSAISPKRIFSNDDSFKKIVPLSAISNRKTVMCNESGEWIIYDSDRYGFNNPDNLWDNLENDLIILGDSFAYGACVNQNENISAYLNLKNFDNLNLAFSGNGPLSMLGSLKEYGKTTKPKFVLWVYYEGNDLIDLKRELSYKSFNFKKYLQKNFSQNLVNKQTEVDTLLNNLYQNNLKQKIEEKSKQHKKMIDENRFLNKIHSFDYKKAIKLYNVRTLLGLINIETEDYIYDNFKKILLEAKNYSTEINSELIFVYLPRYYKTMAYTNIYNKKKVLNIVKSINVDIVDIDILVFKNHPDPHSLFPFRRKNHYNALGYKLVAEEISKYLLRNKIIK